MSKNTKQILNGVALIQKYEPDADFHGEHDELYFGTYDVSASQMTPEELAQMEEWGWTHYEETWRHYASM